MLKTDVRFKSYAPQKSCQKLDAMRRRKPPSCRCIGFSVPLGYAHAEPIGQCMLSLRSTQQTLRSTHSSQMQNFSAILTHFFSQSHPNRTKTVPYKNFIK